MGLVPHNRFILFLDLMGFGQFVTSIGHLSDQLELVSSMLEEAQSLAHDRFGSELTFQFLSDCLFISSVNADSTNASNVINAAQQLSVFFLTKGYLVRGGMTHGLCVSTDGIVLGEPVVRAVKLEERVAVYPRIILGKQCARQVRQIIDQESFSRDLIQSEDGPYFVNPFSSVCKTLLELDAAIKGGDVSPENAKFRKKHICSLNKCAETIENGLEENQDRPEVFRKYAWLSKVFKRALKPVRSQIGNEIRSFEVFDGN